MKSVVHWNYELENFAEDTEEDILSSIRYDIGEKVLLVGSIGNLGKKLRTLGIHVTILENGAYNDICYSLIFNENCSIVKGCLEMLPFEDNSFDKVFILNHFNYTSDQQKALKEIYRVLKLKGQLILEDSDARKLKVKLKAFKNKVCGDRVKYHRPQELINMFTKFNFSGSLAEIESQKYIYIGNKK